MATRADVDRLYLASMSPRRRALLEERGIAFEMMDPHVDESLADARDPVKAAVELAKRKAHSVSLRVPSGFVIGADTIVWLDSESFGKPRDRSDARRILGLLSGRTHQVTTGYAIIRMSPPAIRLGHATTRVTMRHLSPNDIEALVSSGEADDKAGAYGIQGAASRFVAIVEGGRDTVVGLPVQDVLDALFDLGFRHPSGVAP